MEDDSKKWNVFLLKSNNIVRKRSRTIIRPNWGLALLLVYAALFSGCAFNARQARDAQNIPSHPDAQWNPPANVIDKHSADRITADNAVRKEPSIPSEYRDNIQKLVLADIVDIALLNSKLTRQTWAYARAAAATHYRERSQYLPEIDATAADSKQKSVTSGGNAYSKTHTYSANASLGWLLFDFGGRKATMDATREALYAADWAHNAMIQRVILEVEQSYYDYFAAKALLAAQQAGVEEAQTNLNAAEERHSSGVSTIADVLQAKTALSQAMLALATLEGQIMTTRGVLATAMGLPANTSFDVELPVGAPPLEMAKMSVEEYLDTALKERPDLLAARAQALGADAQVRAIQARGYPSISATGSIGKMFYDDLSDGKDTYSAKIGLSVPLFTGFARHYEVMAARARADAAFESAKNVQDLITLQVWTSYYNVETADQLVRTSDDLMASATQNHDVAAGRYKNGVGSILDLLTAQAALESARAQQIRARANWWGAITQLAHDTGTLEASNPTGTSSGETIDRKGNK